MKIFVYGTLRKSCCREHVLAQSNYLGLAFAEKGRLFDVGSYPAFVVESSGYKVIGEVYEVDKNKLQELDQIEGYFEDDRRSSLYVRNYITVIGFNGETHDVQT